MYLRPRSIFERFHVAEKLTRVNEQGRNVVEYRDTERLLFGVLSTTTAYEREKFQSMKHEASHYIVQRGEPRAKIGDLLVNGTRRFLIQSVENPCGLNEWTTYLVNERADL